MGQRYHLRTAILIPCSDRKRGRPSKDLLARSLPAGSLSEVAGEWCDRVSSATLKQPHTKVYCGRSYQEASNAAAVLSADLVVISAGLGLVRADRQIPNYSLTVAPGSEDSVLTKIKCDGDGPSDWWGALKARNNECVGVHDIIRGEPSTLFLVALSASYARLIQEDLLELSAREAQRVRIFGASIVDHLPPNLTASVMPYDTRLNGPDSPLPGTMSDYASRALRHYAGCLADGVLSANNAANDRQQLSALMMHWRVPNALVRERMTDEQLIGFIQRHWHQTEGRSGTTLRLLRNSGHACEQGRFRDLFRRASILRIKAEDGVA
jgi:hypothetical protein